MIFILRSSFIIIYTYLYHIFGDFIISFFTQKNISGRPRRRLLRVAVASVAVALGLVALLCPDRGTGTMQRDKGGIVQ
jgi:uncharacterized protein involved in response to NO